MQIVRNEKRETTNLGPSSYRDVIMPDLVAVPLYCENEKCEERSLALREIYSSAERYNYVEWTRERGWSSSRNRRPLSDSDDGISSRTRPPYRETSCISLFMYENRFKRVVNQAGRKYE